MTAGSTTTELVESRSAGQPFREAIGLTPLGDGRYGAELGLVWAVGDKAHGGLLLVLLAQAALARLDSETAVQGGAPGLDPLAIGAEFLRAPDPGPVELHTEVLKLGRTASVAAVRLFQAGRLMLSATVTAGRLPDEAPRWTDLPDLPAEPPADALDPSRNGGSPGQGLAAACELRFDASTTPFAVGEQGPPVVRGWTRPLGEEPDVLFALLAGDILPPTVFNLGGGVGWAPTVQLTALMRGRPAPGWLRLESRSATVAGPWFDEDLTVIDSAGRLVCQARQIALSPLVP
ncbi:thioesterase family protein [Pseudonocardia bannensis]|uniref:thioesterase family protein n=1 Tax=Pseudonocardia bannensis TaxID=630973 RepID=UPI0028AD79A1|nr:thioesterase family protein [Pseudonocardia bannensis]